MFTAVRRTRVRRHSPRTWRWAFGVVVLLGFGYVRMGWCDGETFLHPKVRIRPELRIPSRQYKANETNDRVPTCLYYYERGDYDRLVALYLGIYRASRDERTGEVASYVLDSIYINKKQNRSGISLGAVRYIQEDAAKWALEKGPVESRLRGSRVPADPEPFYYAHGLRFTTDGVRNYVRDRDFLDIGAYRGESMVGLSTYTRKAIYSYELVPAGFEFVREAAEAYNNGSLWRGTASKCVAMNKAVSNRNGTTGASTSWSEAGARMAGEDGVVEMVTIDEEVERLQLKVGFIKADVEGFALAVLEGALATLKRDRPVLSIAVYHRAVAASGPEFTTVPEFLLGLGFYRLELRTETFADHTAESLADLRIFAVPIGVT
jgi:FkbM family methyltransferase